MLYKETSNKLVSIERLIIEQKASCNLLTSLQNLLVSSDPLGRGVLLSSLILSSPTRPCDPITLSPLHPNQWSNSGPGPKYQITSIRFTNIFFMSSERYILEFLGWQESNKMVRFVLRFIADTLDSWTYLVGSYIP